MNSANLELEKGQVLGLVGPNGAGKTTLIKHILGLLSPDSGSVATLGYDPVTNRERVLGSLGYVSEHRDLPGWMRICDMLAFLEPFYPTWDREYAGELCERFELQPKQRIGTLSLGQLARTALVRALSFRPPLLVFDEPTSGLDPVVRNDFAVMVQEKVAEGCTVLFSSHLLDEVVKVCDHLALMLGGRIVLSGELAEALDRYVIIHVNTLRETDAVRAVDGVVCVQKAESGYVILAVQNQSVIDNLQLIGVSAAAVRKTTLTDLFLVIASSDLDCASNCAVPAV